ncbi:MAG: ATP-binding protein [Gammaproteobacteria bacterium]|nr:ATP-binding protein [Gammaproteobacteria bacterium]
MPNHFVGREQELEILKTYFSKGTSCFLVIKGRRRIGKSRLVEEFSQGKTFYRFSGLPPEKEVTAQTQRDDFARRLTQYFPELPALKANEWSELFELLAKRTQKGKTIILLDEIAWMAYDDPAFLGKLKNVWDEWFKQNPNLMLILCGSISSWIEKNILASTAFLGRIHYVITLRELPLPVCAQFWESSHSHISAYDQLKLLAITGGVPLYLENINPKIPVDDNIQRLCFESGGLLFREFDNIFHDLFNKRSSYYKQIVKTLVNHPADMETICADLGVTSGGIISECLTNLVKAGFICRDYGWALKTGIPSKLSRYRLSDNYLRFYLHYIDKQKVKIKQGLYQHHAFNTLPEWSTILGLQFENLILSNRPLIWEQLGLSVNDIINEGVYFQKQTKQHPGCQIDYLIQTRYHNLFVCEVKFSRNTIKKEIIDEVGKKISDLTRPKHFSCFPVLIHANEVSDAVVDSAYFIKIIELGTLFN